MDIVPACSESQYAEARRLFEKYMASLGVDLYFQEIDRELAGLPGDYAPPHGRLLLATEADQTAGCVALRRLGDGISEMKRLYVRPAFRGRKIGRRLAQAVIDEARRIGYRAMRLDTLDRLVEARALYRSLGFQPIEAYTFNPIPGALFMELRLN